MERLTNRLSGWFGSTTDSPSRDPTALPPRKRSDHRDREQRRRCRECKNTEAFYLAAQDELESKTKQLHELQCAFQSLQSNLNDVVSAKTSVEERCRRVENYAEGLKKRIGQLEGDLGALNKAKAEGDKALLRAENERKNLIVLLDTRTAELKEAQTYLSKVDDVSDSDVLHLVESINSHVYQTAAKIANDFQSSYGAQENTVARQEAAQRLEESTLVGSDLPSLLVASNHQRDSILVQIALQTLFTTLLFHLSSPWSKIFDKRLPFLQSIYAEMRKREPQSVFGRWRAMTLTYTHAVLGERTTNASNAARSLLSHINDVLLAAGTKDNANLNSEQYKKSLKALTTQALELRHIAGVRVVSGDFQTTIAWPDEPYAPERIDDEWADPKDAGAAAPSGAQICSTTHLGLVRREWHVEGGKGARAGGMERELVLLKPKVILHHTLQEILEDFLSEPDEAASERTESSAA
ncbi:hypothetical protein PYCCODRAFT_1438138 [Trametes coccinea BRFM310]|uniref:Uncharacterized protein n=1 Tax=Trametes coccinea (strain BRFM310) TaxID=1353009 RepID=A0A1Y2IG29_TRAC3|nr:hypothetical protein PYCCODRAFT_1438138 [Trametes coccinea BRFM310]